MPFIDNSAIYRDINRTLPEICTTICAVLEYQAQADDTTRILASHIRKAERSLRAVNLLHDNELWEPAQMLVRALFELQINYNHFLRMYQGRPREACARLMDAMVLITLKHFRSASAAIDVDEAVMSFAQAEGVILKRYPPDEVRKLTKYGFTGVPLDQAAIAIQQGDIYNTVYRLFSRNVHSTDHVEMMTLDDLEDDPEGVNSLRARNELSFYIAGISVASMLDLTNRIRKCGLDDPIAKVSGAFEEARKKIAEQAGGAYAD